MNYLLKTGTVLLKQKNKKILKVNQYKIVLISNKTLFKYFYNWFDKSFLSTKGRPSEAKRQQRHPIHCNNAGSI